MKNLLIILMMILLIGCSESQRNIEISQDDVIAKLNVSDTNLTIGKDFELFITIENNSDETIEIDTSPDEVIVAPSETSGGEYKQNGSQCSISFTQQYNGRLGFFSTTGRKILSQQESSKSFTIKPKRQYKLKYVLGPWGPTYGSSPSTASAGPAEIKVILHLIINGQTINIEAEPIEVHVFEKK